MIDGQIRDNFTLKEHQKEGAKFLLNHSKAVLAYATGSGKSVTALVAFAATRKLGRGSRAVIVCDRSSMVSLISDVEERTNLTYHVFEKGSENVPNVDFVFVTYNKAIEMFQYEPFAEQLVAGAFSHIILDEIQKVKNALSGVSQGLSYFTRFFQYVWCLTATLMSNSIEDIYGIFNFLVPGMFGTRWAFLDRFCILEKKTIKTYRRDAEGRMRPRDQEITEIVGYRNLNQLGVEISGYTCYYTIDYKINYYPIKVTLTEGEKQIYATASRGLDNRKQRSDDVVRHSTRMHDLQLSIDLAESRKTTKQVALGEWLATHSLDGGLVYFTHRDSLDSSFFYYEKQYPIEIISGDVSSKRRAEIKAWLRPGHFVFLTSAGAQSLNLDAVNNLLLFDIPFSVMEVSQLIGRIARMSSPYKEFNVFMLETLGTIDQYKTQLIGVHAKLIHDVIGGYKNLPDVGFLPPAELKALKNDLLWVYRKEGKRNGKRVSGGR